MSLDPLPLPPSRRMDPLDNPILQRDSARELAAVLADRNDRALAIHERRPGFSIVTGGRTLDWCSADFHVYPCPTVRALTGDDEDEPNEVAA
jgi:hypothetical protein